MGRDIDADLWTRVVAFVPVGRWDRLRLVSSSARDAVAQAATQPPYDGSFLIFLFTFSFCYGF